jgi:hypothetical protein
MPPTEALFDAVNRGDTAAVRDALSRGADINAQNILGITATELAVDLGRNDIAFLLLSMRGAEAPRGPRGQTITQAAAPPAATAPKATPPARQASSATRVAARQAETPAPTLFANDGGTPVPSAGFLGFDAGRAGR